MRKSLFLFLIGCIAPVIYFLFTSWDRFQGETNFMQNRALFEQIVKYVRAKQYREVSGKYIFPESLPDDI
uniref:Uncharacterized protein n=1 Tax=Cyanothece sp. (strain PCC 7425 / ATCC 29141) TaxID=395961 RepID=B8HL16_CYAP4